MWGEAGTERRGGSRERRGGSGTSEASSWMIEVPTKAGGAAEALGAAVTTSSKNSNVPNVESAMASYCERSSHHITDERGPKREMQAETPKTMGIHAMVRYSCCRAEIGIRRSDERCAELMATVMTAATTATDAAARMGGSWSRHSLMKARAPFLYTSSVPSAIAVSDRSLSDGRSRSERESETN